MKLFWSKDAWEDYLYWQDNDADVLGRINAVLQDIRRNPVKGIGKPEPLRGDLSGWWSRRITGDHRIVYRVRGSGEEAARRNRRLPISLFAPSLRAQAISRRGPRRRDLSLTSIRALGCVHREAPPRVRRERRIPRPSLTLICANLR